MSVTSVNIREIRLEDNADVAKIIRKVLLDLGMPKVGTAYADASLDAMYKAYDVPKAIYLVVEEQGKIIGGAGIAPLANEDGNICELQKMYFLEVARGRGLGAKMLNECIRHAKLFGYDKMYLETMPFMTAAQKLYKASGFIHIQEKLGDTGHCACPVFMVKDLK